jgi:hypothetical protein
MDEAKRVFGDHFLCYVLACEPSALDGSDSSEAQQSVIQELESFVGLIGNTRGSNATRSPISYSTGALVPTLRLPTSGEWGAGEIHLKGMALPWRVHCIDTLHI